MRPEDYLCCAGIIVGGVIVIAASWTANPTIAEHLITTGDAILGGFFILWITSKIFRHHTDND